MRKKVLVTGGAGFIGSHLCDALLSAGHEVRVLDNLSEQVHGKAATRPSYLDKDVELVVGDVRDGNCVRKCLRGVEVLYHLAARVGVGQSMYQVAEYVSHNEGGTSVVLQGLLEQPVERLVVASSMSLYGEGLYRTEEGQLVPGRERTREQLQAHRWELETAAGVPLLPVPTPEWKPAALASIYALSKFDQEQMCLLVGQTYRIPTVALRFFNVYGPRQALSNPYTGVLAIFASRLLNGHAPVIFEDGLQQRDFVHVRDVARACVLAMEKKEAAGEIINVGSGEHYSILEVARRISRALNQSGIDPAVLGNYRAGDIRHCFADIGKARAILGYQPKVGFEAGMQELAEWLGGEVAEDRVEEATAELVARGLTA